MRQHKKKKSSSYAPVLVVIKGGKSEPTPISKLVSSAWNFAYTALWNTSVFSASEIEAAKATIKDYLISAKDQQKAFSAFIQRVLLAKQYLNNNPGKFVPLPSVWLSKENENGFPGTKAWYENLQSVRQSLPLHKIELKAFAEAISEMSEEPSSKNFQYWRSYFIEKKTPGLLNLFLATVANQQFL